MDVTFDPDAYKDKSSDPFLPRQTLGSGLDFDELAEANLETYSLNIITSEFQSQIFAIKNSDKSLLIARPMHFCSKERLEKFKKILLSEDRSEFE